VPNLFFVHPPFQLVLLPAIPDSQVFQLAPKGTQLCPSFSTSGVPAAQGHSLCAPKTLAGVVANHHYIETSSLPAPVTGCTDLPICSVVCAISAIAATKSLPSSSQKILPGLNRQFLAPREQKSIWCASDWT
jgi:hypothetical protein